MTNDDLFKEALYHAKEEVYLEYKGDVSWNDRNKKIEIIQTIFAMANEKGGGQIIVGVADNGELVGLSEDNFNSYSHDHINTAIKNKGNQSSLKK